jgi:hypothetical protein
MSWAMGLCRSVRVGWSDVEMPPDGVALPVLSELVRSVKPITRAKAFTDIQSLRRDSRSRN